MAPIDACTKGRPAGMTGTNLGKRVAGLLSGFLMVALFIFYLGPWMSENLPLVRPVTHYIEANDIDAGALYYTEVEEFSTAEINMKNTMDFPPDASRR